MLLVEQTLKRISMTNSNTTDITKKTRKTGPRNRPVKRRTKAQIQKDKTQDKNALARMRAQMVQFTGRAQPRNSVDEVAAPCLWDGIQERDRNYQVRTYLDNTNRGRSQEEEEEHFDSDSDCDDDEEEDDVTDMEYDSDAEEDGLDEEIGNGSVMGRYLRSIQRQLKIECTRTNPGIDDEGPWLLQYLKNHKFWIRAESAPLICKKLSHTMCLHGYYQDVRVWLPDEEFGMSPPCPSCHSNSRIGVHGYSGKTPARRVIGLTSHYFLMTRRYICHHCEKVDIDPKPKYTFRGYNEESVKHLPRQHGLEMPALLTHKLAIDKQLISMMRPLFDGGVRPNRFRKMIAELHHKEHNVRALLHEYCDEGKVAPSKLEQMMFSGFYDKFNYNGFIPGAKWFRRCYSKYMKLIRYFQDNEMKKRGARILKIDACYKPCKKIKRLNGQKVVSAIITVKNECNEDRSQWLVPTDAQDQYVTPLTRMVETSNQLGQCQPRIAYVDNPNASLWLLDTVPSLRRTQDKYDKMAADDEETEHDKVVVEHGNEENENQNDVSASRRISPAGTVVSIPEFDTWFSEHSTYLTSKTSIERNAEALVGHLGLDNNDNDKNKIVMGLDLEWFVPTNSAGDVIGRGERTSLIQIGYEDGDDVKVVLYQVTNIKALPSSLCKLLEHPRTQFTGSAVSGDLKKLVRDFAIDINADEKSINLERMALSRGVCLNGKGLSSICFSLFNIPVPKDLQKSNWKQRNLPVRLQKYAAKDGCYSLYAYQELRVKPDLTRPPLPSEISGGMKVDIAPYLSSSTSIFNNGCCAATGTVVADIQEWDVPDNLKVPSGVAEGKIPGHFLIEIDSVESPALKIKGITIRGTTRYASLCDLGPLPARASFPIEMIRVHAKSRPRLVMKPRQVALSTADSNTTLFDLPTFIDAMEEIENDDEDNEKNGTNENDDSPNAGHHDNDDAFINEASLNLNNPECIIRIEQCIKLGETQGLSLPGREWKPKEGVNLERPPTTVKDVYSAILGSGFHAGHRIIAPVNHCHKKAFFVALSEAMYAWDECDMRSLEEALRENVDMSSHDFSLFRYFRRRYFLKRVKRHCLPPSKLYWRVRAVFEVFGSQIDSKSNKPLFNNLAWTKANGILKEIICGFYTDPPDEVLYRYQLCSNGNIKYDRHGIPLLSCDRDTNALEGEHSHINNTFGRRSVGIQFADDLLAERRHRSVIEASKKNRLDYPNIEHYDTWYIDAHQERVLEKHNVLVNESWVNASALFTSTPERFGVVSLASPELTKKINETVKLPKEYKLSPTLAFLSSRCECIIAPQPWSTPEEIKLYPRLILQAQQAIGGRATDTEIDEYICNAILSMVNGRITPKLPVYNRLFRKRYSHIQRCKAAVKNLVRENEALKAVNQLTTILPDESPGFQLSDEHEEIQLEQSHLHLPSESPATSNLNTTRLVPNPALQEYIRTNLPPLKNARAISVQMPPSIPQINPNNFQPIFTPVFVGGVPMNSLRFQPGILLTRPCIENSRRRGDNMKRQKRTCKICKLTDCLGAKTRMKTGVVKHCSTHRTLGMCVIEVLDRFKNCGVESDITDYMLGNDDDQMRKRLKIVGFALQFRNSILSVR